ncbi:hypothetical protein PBRA_002291 [Plasmodiophora brassicae]|nr:hypothetical protein PBRA_002291 [Plasmodiophora brassicae]
MLRCYALLLLLAAIRDAHAQVNVTKRHLRRTLPVVRCGLCPHLENGHLKVLADARVPYWTAEINHVLELRETWTSLFRPDTTPDVLLDYFELPYDPLVAAASVNWARQQIADQHVPLRMQILFLNHLFDIDGVPVDEFSSMVETATIQWGLPPGFAMGVAFRHAVHADRYSRDHRQQCLQVVHRLLDLGARFSEATFDDWISLQALHQDVALRLNELIDFSDAIVKAAMRLAREALQAPDYQMVRTAVEFDVGDTISDGLLRALVEHGLDINAVDEALCETRFTSAFVNGHVSKAALLIELGADFENVLTPSSAAHEDNWWDLPLEREMSEADSALLQCMLKYSVDPAEAFSNFFAAFRPETVTSLTIRMALESLPEIDDASLWAHRVLDRLLANGYDRSITDLIGFIGNDMSLTSDMGTSLLVNMDICKRQNPIDDLEQLTASSTEHQIRSALSTVDPVSGRTVLHKNCMTVEVYRWISQRSSVSVLDLDWSGRTCLDYWVLDAVDHVRPHYEVAQLVQLFWLALDLGPDATTMYDLVVRSCTEWTRMRLERHPAVLQELYYSASARFHPILEHIREFVTDVVVYLHSLDAGSAGYLLHGALMSITIGGSDTDIKRQMNLISMLCCYDYGRLMLVQWPSDGWTPLHRAAAHPCLHQFVPVMLTWASRYGILETLLHVADVHSRTFLHVIADRLEYVPVFISRRAGGSYPYDTSDDFDALLRTILAHLTGMSPSGRTGFPVLPAPALRHLFSARDGLTGRTFLDLVKASLRGRPDDSLIQMSTDIIDAVHGWAAVTPLL